MKTPSVYKYLPTELAERLNGFGFAARRPVVGAVQGVHRSPHLGASVEFAEYREYAPGDPVPLIDWAVYARSDRYVIRRFREETNVRAYLLLDISASMNFRLEGGERKIDYACRLAAGLMYVLLRQGDAVGLLTYDDDVRDAFAPTGSFEGIRPLLRHLETLELKRAGRIEEALTRAAPRLRPRSVIILLSDLLDTPESALRGLRRLRHEGHDLTVFHVLDPGEIHLTGTGIAELRDVESGRRLTANLDEVRLRYTREVDRWLDALRLGCADGLANYILSLTGRPTDEVLRERLTRN